MTTDERANSTEKPEEFAKGSRAAIVRGSRDVGVRGTVFWIGPNKYGPGQRYGLRGDDGNTYWVDQADIGVESDAPPAPERPEEPVLEKGSSVRIVSGREGVGVVGEIFWSGPNKYGSGTRYGVRAGEDTFWVNGGQVELADPSPAAGGNSNGPIDAMRGDEAPLPIDDFADPVNEGWTPSSFQPVDAQALAPPSTEDDVPFPTQEDASVGTSALDDEVPFPDDDLPF